MRQLALTILLLIIMGVIIFFILDAILHEDFDMSVYERGIPLAIASFALLATPYLHQLLQGRRRRFSLTELPDKIVQYDDYLLPWSVLLLYGVLFLYAASGVAIVLIWLVGQASGFFITRAIAILDFLLLTVAIFLAGSWVGTRARRHPYLSSGVIVFFYSVLAVTTLSLFRDSFRLIPFFIITGLLFLVALVGTWAGTRRRVAEYIRYLLSFVSRSEHAQLADSVFQEVVTRSSPGSVLQENAGNQAEAVVL